MVNKRPRKKTIYCLRTRYNDNDDWGEEEEFESKRERDETASYCRILMKMRTWSYSKLIPKELETQ